MEIQVWQIIALTILSMILIWDSLSTAIFDGKPMFAGILAGIIMGDITTGLPWALHCSSWYSASVLTAVHPCRTI